MCCTHYFWMLQTVWWETSLSDVRVLIAPFINSILVGRIWCVYIGDKNTADPKKHCNSFWEACFVSRINSEMLGWIVFFLNVNRALSWLLASVCAPTIMASAKTMLVHASVSDDNLLATSWERPAHFDEILKSAVPRNVSTRSLNLACWLCIMMATLHHNTKSATDLRL